MESIAMVTKTTFRFVFILATAFLFHGCASTSHADKTAGELDIKLTKAPAQSLASAKDDKNNSSKDESGLVIPADAVINWQEFFKAAPTKDQRQQLEQTLQAYKPSGSVEDL